jgi:type II secretory pathway pseudopilin PulG
MTRARLSDESGFTIVEALAAAVVLVIGLMGVVLVLDAANGATGASKAREQGTALERSLVEEARTIPYNTLTPTGIVDAIRATPAFSDSTIGYQGWQVQRRGVTYHVTAGVCSVDDPADGIGTHDAATFCANGAGTTTAAECQTYLGTNGSVAGTGTATGGAVGDCGIDRNFDGIVDNLTESQAGGCNAASGTCTVTSPADDHPDDYKRIVLLVRWDVGRGARFALQSTTLPYPGFAGAPRVITFDTPATTVTDPNVQSIAFTATSTRAAAVGWYVDGTPAGTATDSGGGTQWSFSWPLGPVGTNAPGDNETAGGPKEVLDGTYTLSARGMDASGAGGALKSMIVTINRRRPYAPPGLLAIRVDNTVEVQWQLGRARDLVGYKVFRRDTATNQDQLVCDLRRQTTCRDTSLPSSGSYSYVAYGYDLDPGNAQRPGDAAVSSSVPMSNQVPTVPGNLAATRQDVNTVKLNWQNARDTDGSVAQYRIYRDGTALYDAYATSPASTYTDLNAGGGPHTYTVVAVDNAGAESARTAVAQA